MMAHNNFAEKDNKLLIHFLYSTPDFVALYYIYVSHLLPRLKGVSLIHFSYEISCLYGS